MLSLNCLPSSQQLTRREQVNSAQPTAHGLARIFHTQHGPLALCSGVSSERRRFQHGVMRRSGETPLQEYEISGLGLRLAQLLLRWVCDALRVFEAGALKIVLPFCLGLV